MTDFSRFTQRLHILTGLFFLLVLVIAGRALQLAWISQERFLRAGEKIALRVSRIPARRGEIRDKNNVLLAWNERHFELWSTLADNESFSTYQLETLSKKFPRRHFAPSPDSKTPLFFRLTPQEVMDLEPLIKSGFPLKIKSKVTRLTLNNAALRKKIGKTENGAGISGWEKEYNFLLQGRDGRFSVLLDRRRNWIPSSWKMLQEPVHGQDVKVPFAVDPSPRTRSRSKW